MLRLVILSFVLACATLAPATDCNLNGADDATDSAPDFNANTIPDICDLFPLTFIATSSPAGSDHRRQPD